MDLSNGTLHNVENRWQVHAQTGVTLTYIILIKISQTQNNRRYDSVYVKSKNEHCESIILESGIRVLFGEERKVMTMGGGSGKGVFGG